MTKQVFKTADECRDHVEQAIRNCGMTVSGASYMKSDYGCVFSVQTCGAATFNSPKVCYTPRLGEDGLWTVWL